MALLPRCEDAMRTIKIEVVEQHEPVIERGEGEAGVGGACGQTAQYDCNDSEIDSHAHSGGTSIDAVAPICRL